MLCGVVRGDEQMLDKTYPVSRTDAEWRRILSPEQFYVMRGTRHGGTRQLRAARREAPGPLHLCRMRSTAVRVKTKI